LGERSSLIMHNPQETTPEDPSLRILMAEYQAGSVDAFDRLHDALASDLKAYLTRLSRDPTRADDLLQETFLQMHRSRAAHTPGQPVRPWVFAIAKRVFLMYRRSTARRTRRELIAADHKEESITAPDAERLHARREVEWVLRQVPPDGRRAFVLHHLFGCSFKEVAARLGIKTGAAKIRSSRAANFMRALLRESRDE
jgi:RNA polymerase sigma-70 factor, ECF subfamily